MTTKNPFADPGLFDYGAETVLFFEVAKNE